MAFDRARSVDAVRPLSKGDNTFMAADLGVDSKSWYPYLLVSINNINEARTVDFDRKEKLGGVGFIRFFLYDYVRLELELERELTCTPILVMQDLKLPEEYIMINAAEKRNEGELNNTRSARNDSAVISENKFEYFRDNFGDGIDKNNPSYTDNLVAKVNHHFFQNAIVCDKVVVTLFENMKSGGGLKPEFWI